MRRSGIKCVNSLSRQSARLTGTVVNDCWLSTCVRAMRESKVVYHKSDRFVGVTNTWESTAMCNSEYFIVEFSSLVCLSVELSCLGRCREVESSCPESESIKGQFRSSSNPTMRLSSSNSVPTEEILLEQQALQWALTCTPIQQRNNATQKQDQDHTALLNFTHSKINLSRWD